LIRGDQVKRGGGHLPQERVGDPNVHLAAEVVGCGRGLTSEHQSNGHQVLGEKDLG